MNSIRVLRYLPLLALALLVLPLAGCCCSPCDRQVVTIPCEPPTWLMIKLKNRSNAPVTQALARPVPSAPVAHSLGLVPPGAYLQGTQLQEVQTMTAHVSVQFESGPPLSGSGAFATFVRRLDPIDVWDGGGSVTAHLANGTTTTFPLTPTPPPTP